MKLVGYARVSDKEQVKKGYSIEGQQESIQAWSAENNHTLIKIFIEPARSGSKPSRKTRPTFEAAILFILAGGADGLVVKWMDRFSRNVEDFLRVRSQLYQASKHLISISEPLLNGDPADPVARYISTAIMNAYQLQAELSGLKAAQGRERRAKQGNYPGSVPIGYIRLDKKILPDPDFAPIIIEAFYQFSSGFWTLESWTDESKKRGYTTRKQNCISKSQWHRVLRNIFYIGQYRWKEIVYNGDYKPLINDEIYQAVQEILDKNSNGNTGHRYFWLLAKLLWSDQHHKTMNGALIKGKYRYYRATSKEKTETEHNVQAEEIEQRVVDYLELIKWTGEPVTISENWKLALNVANNTQQVYLQLTSQAEKRLFLRTIFFTKGIRVLESGRISQVDLLPGFAIIEK